MYRIENLIKGKWVLVARAKTDNEAKAVARLARLGGPVKITPKVR